MRTCALLLFCTALLLSGCARRPTKPPRSPNPTNLIRPIRPIRRISPPQPAPPAASTSLVLAVLGPGSLRGRIILANGAPVTGACVWAEQLTGAAVQDWQRQLRTPLKAAPGSVCVSDATGEFVISTVPRDAAFVVKSAPAMLPPALAGPFGGQHAVPEYVTLTIPLDGGRLTGTFTDDTGAPCTNVMIFHTKRAHDPNWEHDERLPVMLQVDADGSYLTEMLAPNEYEFTFYAPWHLPLTRRVLIRLESDEALDLVFHAMPILTGIVVDAKTQLPVMGAVVINTDNDRGDFTNCEIIQTTRMDGLFTCVMQKYLCVFCFHADYESEMYQYHGAQPPSNIVIALTRETGTICVRVQTHAGAPVTNGGVRLDPTPPPVQDSSFFTTRLRGGSALFERIQTRYAPYIASAFDLVKSPPIALAPGEYKEVWLTLPPMGALHLRFSAPVIRGGGGPRDEWRGVYAVCHGAHGMREFYTTEMTPTLWPARDMLTGIYRTVVDGDCVTRWETNVEIFASATTVLDVPVLTQNVGVIEGSITTRNGLPVSGYITVDGGTFHRSFPPDMFPDGRFAIRGLDPQTAYDLFLTPAPTNIYVRAVLPGGPPLQLVIDPMYRLTGTVKDENGTPLRARLGFLNLEWNCDGAFQVFPVACGRHVLIVEADGYARAFQEVDVQDGDVDVGDIILKDRGVTLRGSVTDTAGNPCSNMPVQVRAYYDERARATGNSCWGAWPRLMGTREFMVPAVPRNVLITIGVGLDTPRELGRLTADTDCGTLVINPAAAP